MAFIIVGRRVLSATRRRHLRLLSTPAPAYVYHPTVQTLEADIQALHWTKTVQVNDPPSLVEELRTGLDAAAFKGAVEKCVIVARNFETQEEFHVPKTYPFGLMQNLLKTVLTFAPKHPQLRDLCVMYEPHISATWHHTGKRLAIRGRPGTFLTSKRRHPLFYDRSDIEDGSQYSFEAMGAISPFIDLREYNVNTINSTGLLNGRAFPHFHTLILIDDDGTPEIQLLQKAVVYSFSALMAQAVERHGDSVIGAELPEPECIQCIVTNGKRFSFVWYQLNTLETEDLGEGVRNLVHVDRPGKLYSKIRAIGGRRKKVVEDLNDDILKTLLSVLLLR